MRIPDRTGTDAAFNDQGKPFFPDFKDPLACTDLEVVDYDPTTATRRRFKVKFKDGKWVIPSHYDYPADAKDRLAKTAAGVMDLTKDTIRSDRVEDQEELGVIDPLDTKATILKGRGKRVTLRDKSEKVLADFIIGKEVARPRTGPALRPRAGPEADLRRQRQGRPLDPVRRLDRDQPAEARHRPGSARSNFDNHKVDLDAGRDHPGRDPDDRAQGLPAARGRSASRFPPARS